MNRYEQADHTMPPSGHLSDADGGYLKMFDCAYPRSLPQVAMRETILIADGITNGAIRRVQEDPLKEAVTLTATAIAGAGVGYALAHRLLSAPLVIAGGTAVGAKYLMETFTSERLHNICKATKETAMTDDVVAMRRNMFLMERELGQPALDLFNTCAGGAAAAPFVKQMLRAAPALGEEAVHLMPPGPYAPRGPWVHLGEYEFRSPHGDVITKKLNTEAFLQYLKRMKEDQVPAVMRPVSKEAPLPPPPPPEYEKKDIPKGTCPGRHS